MPFHEVLTLLVFDLGVLHRKAHEIGVCESLWLSAFYITVGLAFSGWVPSKEKGTAPSC